MIKKLKLKFIILSMTSLLLLLAVIVTGMNVVNYNSIVSESDEILGIISQNKGMFPGPSNNPNDDHNIPPRDDTKNDNFKDNRPGESKLPPKFSQEVPYESRHFTVFLNKKGDVINTNLSNIASVNEDKAIEYVNTALDSYKDRGFVNDFRYIVCKENDGIQISFLDCGRKLDAFESFLMTSILMSVAGFVLVFIAIFILSGKIIKPIAEAYKKQKQFITNAGHEIKTPLTIINANVDILEMEMDDSNESLRDIKQQTERLRSLTEDLVMLSRMEEAEKNMSKIEFPISEVISETAHSFKNLCTSQNKELVCNIEPMLSYCGNDTAIEKLIDILLDNAVKYSPQGSTITLTLLKKNRALMLSVVNTTTMPIDSNHLKLVFDRFYRTDNSRNSETGGHGIGLSIAKAIVTAHNGTICAFSRRENLFQITAEFPI